MDPRRSLRRVAGAAALVALAPVASAAQPAQLQTSIAARLRLESTTTPAARADQDRTYALPTARLRLGLDWVWPRVTVHGMLQGAAAWDLPRNAGFGAGPAYLNANSRGRDAEGAGIAELLVRYRDQRYDVTLGRQAFADGAELLPGVPYLDEVQRAKWGERLLGNWDWVAAGRRWDGVAASTRSGPAQVSGFYLRPLQGGVNVRRSLRRLDDLEVYGATVSSPYGLWAPHSSFRLAAIHYSDRRPAAIAAAGGGLALDTLVVGWLLGNEEDALLVWAARQSGEWGRQRQRATAFVLGAGHRFADLRGAPAVYLGFERASGGGRSAPHRSFFNLLPTNHKFYGSMDYSAFSNLRDVYLEGNWKPLPRLGLQLGLHDFALVDGDDAWYGGSGAFDDAALGFPARRPASGRFRHRDLGRELDVDLVWALRPGLDLRVGAARFDGGAAAREALPAAADGSWGYVELTLRR